MVGSESEYEGTFKKDTVVEVSSEEDGFRGSWYTATVLRTFSRKSRKILVEYHNLMEDDAGSKPLRELVDAILVRPIPPREPHRLYSLMEDVDAYHNDGWWEGVVTNILDASNTYSVFFRCSREQIDFSPSDLRLHREWVKGNVWVPPLERYASPSPGKRKRSGEDGRDGSHSASVKDSGRGGEGETDVGRRSTHFQTRQDLILANGRCAAERRRSNRLVSNDMVARKIEDANLRVSSNAMCKTHELGINGKLKEPRRRATNNAGFSVHYKGKNGLDIGDEECNSAMKDASSCQGLGFKWF